MTFRPHAALLAATVLFVAGPLAAGAAPNKPIPAKLTVQPSNVTSGALVNLQFKFQATVAFTNVPVTLVVPAGWTAPVSSPSTANGYVSVTKGTCAATGAVSISGSGPWTVNVAGVTCGANKSFTLTYARTRATTAGPATFTSTVNAVALVPAVVNVTVGSAARLAVTQQPAGATGGTAFTTQPKVAVTDAAGNVVTSSTAPVTLSLAGGTSGAALTCTANPRSAVSGVATFAGCKVNKVGTGYTLHATSGALTATDSAAFDVVAGPVASLAFTVQPDPSMISGARFVTAPEVTLYDAGGNVATAATVILGIEPGTPVTGGGGVVNGCPPHFGSVVTFADPCGMGGSAGEGWRLRASILGNPSLYTTSNPFDVVAQSATQVVFTQSPGGSITGGVPFPDQPVVQIQDGSGNAIAGNYTVTLSITGGTPVFGGPGALSGCVPDSAGNGTVTFSGCSIDAAGVDYQLHAEVSGLTPDDSAAFLVVTGPAAAIDLVLDPATIDADVGSTPATATVTDAGGNPVSGETVVIDSTTASSSGAVDVGDGTYTATISTTVAGVHVVNASIGASLTDDAELTVVPGDPASLTLTLDPDSFGTDDSTAATIVIQDAHGNGIAGLSPTLTSDPDTSIDSVSNEGDGSYTATIRATEVGLHNALAELGFLSDDKDFLVTAGSAASIDLVLDPSTVDADTGTSTATATVLDSYGNPVTGAAVAITGDDDVAVGTVSDVGDGTYTADVTSTLVGEHAVYAAFGPELEDTETLTITPGAPASLALVLDPDTVAANDPSTATATVTDAYGNPVPGLPLGITSDGDTTVGPVDPDGDGTYSATVSSTVLGPHDVTASYGALFDVETLTVTSGVADHLVFTTQPAIMPDLCALSFFSFDCFLQVFGYIPPATFNGAHLLTSPVVMVADAYGNPVDDGSLVTLSIAAGTGSPSGSVSCYANPVIAVAGYASFEDCSISYAGIGYRLVASSGSLTEATSDAFDIFQAPPSNITLDVSPGTIVADGFDTATATVTLTDFNGTPVTNWYPSLSTSGYAQITTPTNNGDGTYTSTISGTIAGTETITAQINFGYEPSDSESLTLEPGPPSNVQITNGDFQTITVGAAAGESLCVIVKDFYDNVIANTLVEFASLEVGLAGASFTDEPAYTNEFGTVCTGVVANEYAGGYVVRATAGDATIDFTLTNIPDQPDSFTDVLGSLQYSDVGQAYAAPLTLVVVDQFGNPIPDVTVYFAVPSSGASVSLSDNEPETNGDGQVSVTATANGNGGDVEVVASVGAITTTFFLHNST